MLGRNTHRGDFKGLMRARRLFSSLSSMPVRFLDQDLIAKTQKSLFLGYGHPVWKYTAYPGSFHVGKG